MAGPYLAKPSPPRLRPDHPLAYRLRVAWSPGVGATPARSIHGPYAPGLAAGFTPTFGPLGPCLSSTTGTGMRLRSLLASTDPITAPARFTLGVRVRIVTKGSGNMPLWGVYPGQGTSFVNPFESYAIYCLSTGNIAVVHSIGGSEVVFNTLVAIDDGLWHALVASWSGATIRVYIDGREVGSTAQSGAITAVASQVVLGSLSALSTQAYTGQVDAPHLWTTCLSPAAVRRWSADPETAFRPHRRGGEWAAMIDGLAPPAGGFKTWYAGRSGGLLGSGAA